MNLLLNLPITHAATTTLAHALAALWRGGVDHLQRTLARAYQPEVPDEATLRDLGIDRSELASFRAEAEGRVEATRLRVDRGQPWA